jgi:hypothetical protein
MKSALREVSIGIRSIGCLLVAGTLGAATLLSGAAAPHLPQCLRLSHRVPAPICWLCRFPRLSSSPLRKCRTSFHASGQLHSIAKSARVLSRGRGDQARRYGRCKSAPSIIFPTSNPSM